MEYKLKFNDINEIRQLKEDFTMRFVNNLVF